MKLWNKKFRPGRFCAMWCGTKKNNEVTTEPHCLEFVGYESREFGLTPPLYNNRWDYAFKKIKDFSSEQRPRGAPLFNKEGEFLGMIAFEQSDERRLIPLFLPTVKTLTSETGRWPCHLYQGFEKRKQQNGEKSSIAVTWLLANHYQVIWWRNSEDWDEKF